MDPEKISQTEDALASGAVIEPDIGR